jgi:hypothetical protein
METAKAEQIALSEEERVALAWLKAQSSSHNGQCVEFAATAGKIAIRDSKDPDGPTSGPEKDGPRWLLSGWWLVSLSRSEP